MAYHKPLRKRRKSANRRLSMRGMSEAHHTFEVMCSQARRAGELPPSFGACPCGCSSACTMTWRLHHDVALAPEGASCQRRTGRSIGALTAGGTVA